MVFLSHNLARGIPPLSHNTLLQPQCGIGRSSSTMTSAIQPILHSIDHAIVAPSRTRVLGSAAHCNARGTAKCTIKCMPHDRQTQLCMQPPKGSLSHMRCIEALMEPAGLECDSSNMCRCNKHSNCPEKGRQAPFTDRLLLLLHLPAPPSLVQGSLTPCLCGRHAPSSGSHAPAHK